MASFLENFVDKGEVFFQGWTGSWLLVGLLAVFAVAGAGFYLQRAGTRRWVRHVAYGLRIAAFVLLLFLLMEPVLRAEEVVPQQSFLVHLFDTSGSMGIEDISDAPRLAAVDSRTHGTAARKELDRLYRSLEFSFDEDLRARAADEPLEVSDRATDLVAALQRLQVQTAGLPLAGVVLCTDGVATTNARTEDVVAAALALKAPVYAVGSGPETPGTDVWIEKVISPDQAMVGAASTVTVLAGTRGLRKGATVAIYQGDRKIDERRLSTSGDEQTMTAEFQLFASEAGTNAYRAVVETMGEERYPWNNEAHFFMNVVQERQRLLYIEGYPRYEYRSLRAAFEDDERFQVTSIVFLDQQNKMYRQGLNTPQELRQGFPISEGELFGYDVVVIGDIAASAFSEAQLTNLREFVRRKGGGLLFLAGENSFASRGFSTTPLADVLPFNVGRSQATGVELPVLPTQEGIERGIFGPYDPGRAEPAPWDILPPLKGLYPLQGLKPGASALCVIDQGMGENNPPVVAYQRYGNGVSLICGVSGTWPWRFQTASDNPSYDAFWKQMSLILSERLNNRLSITADPPIAAAGHDVTLEVAARDDAYNPDPTAQITLEVTKPDGEVATVTPHASASGAPGTFDYVLAGTTPGTYTVRAATTSGSGAEVQEARAVFIVQEESPELREVRLNEELLREIATASNGAYLHLTEYDDLLNRIEPSEGTLRHARETAIWDQPEFLIALLVLLMAEWTLRRWDNMA